MYWGLRFFNINNIFRLPFEGTNMRHRATEKAHPSPLIDSILYSVHSVGLANHFERHGTKPQDHHSSFGYFQMSLLSLIFIWTAAKCCSQLIHKLIFQLTHTYHDIIREMSYCNATACSKIHYHRTLKSTLFATRAGRNDWCLLRPQWLPVETCCHLRTHWQMESLPIKLLQMYFITLGQEHFK